MSASARNVSRVDLLLTHLHMDHIQGLGFFKPLYTPDLDVHIWGPPSTTMDMRHRLTRYLSPPLFPVRIRDLPCRLTLHDITRERFHIGDFEIMADMVCHPGPTVAYRLTEGGVSFTYMPDHEPALATWRAARTIRTGRRGSRSRPARICSSTTRSTATTSTTSTSAGATVRYPRRSNFARATGVAHLVTFHHDPSHDDDALDRMFAEARKAARSRSRSLRARRARCSTSPPPRVARSRRSRHRLRGWNCSNTPVCSPPRSWPARLTRSRAAAR